MHQRFRKFQLVLIISCLLTSPSALAVGKSNFRTSLQALSRLYEALEYERALDEITRARKFPHSEDDDVTLSLYEGIILADMSRWRESAVALKAALLARPNATLPVKVAPKVQKHFEEVRKEAVQELATRTQPVPAADAPRSAAITPPPAPTPTSDNSANSPLGLPEGSTHRDILRPRFLIPTIGGAALLVAGGVSWALSRQQLSRLRNNDSTLLTRTNVRDTASRGSTYQSLGVGMLGVGLAGLGLAAGLYISKTPSPSASLELSTDGASAYVQGRWK